MPPPSAVQHKVLDNLVFPKVRDRFGGRVRFFISGAAALNPEIADWFHAAGILILEGYGMTEKPPPRRSTTPIRTTIGSVGPALPGSEVRIGESTRCRSRARTSWRATTTATRHR